MPARFAVRSCLIIVAISLVAAVSQATVWNVSASWQLDSAIATMQAGDTVVCAPGDYYPGHGYYITTPNITLTGSTGNRDDVRIHGAGMNVDGGGLNNLIHLAASGITIENLTVQDVNQNAIQIHGENGITSANILNVHTLNIGERHIKGSGRYIDSNVLVQGCLLEQTIERGGYAASSMGYDYIAGIDTMGTSNWTVRNNVMKNIHAPAPSSGGRGAIFIWDGTNDVVENNLIIGCDRGICFGNPSSGIGPDNSIIRNNFIVRGADIGLELCSTSNVKVYNNTIYSDNAGWGRTVSVYSTQTNLLSENNLIRGQVSQNGGVWTDTNSIIGAVVDPSWFVDPLNGDLHLTALATAAINHGIVLSEVANDFDWQTRGSSPDIGADEMVPEPASLTLIGLAAAALLRRRKVA